MIARVQATTKKVQFQGKEAEVWEGISPTGIRFHLFVAGARMMDGQTVTQTVMEPAMENGQPVLEDGKPVQKPVNKVVSAKAKFADELAGDVKIPAPETAALAENIS